MVTNRFIKEEDYPLLKASLEKDEYHSNTSLEFFLEPNTVCSVYEDENGPVLFVRGSFVGQAVILDIQFLDNRAAKRNMRTMLEGFPRLAKLAKENGFTSFLFYTTQTLLKNFCIRRLGFEEHWNTPELLVKYLQEPGPLELDNTTEAC
jgi:hypothetical protein